MNITPQTVAVQPHPVSQENTQKSETSEHTAAKRSLIQTTAHWPVNPPQHTPTDARFLSILEESKEFVRHSDVEMASQYCAALMLRKSEKNTLRKIGDRPPTVTNIPPFSTFGQAWGRLTQALKQEPFARYAQDNNIDISSLRWFPHANAMECSVNGKVQLFSRTTPGWTEASAAVATAAKEVAAGRVESFQYTGEGNASIEVVGNFYGEGREAESGKQLDCIRDLQKEIEFKSLRPFNGPLTPEATRVRQALAHVENTIAMATYNRTGDIGDASRVPTPSERVEKGDRDLAREVSRWVTAQATDPKSDATKLGVIDIPEDSSYVQAVQAYKEALSSDAFKRFMQAGNIDPKTVLIDIKGNLNGKATGTDGRTRWIEFPVEHPQWAAVQPDILKAAREIRGSDTDMLGNYNYVEAIYPMVGILDFYGIRGNYDSPQWLEQNAGLIRDGFPALLKNNPPNDAASLAVRERQQAAKQRLERMEGLPTSSFPTPPLTPNLTDAVIPTSPATPPVGSVDIIAQRLFAGEPNMQMVVAGLLKDAISKASPSLDVDVQQLAFAVPDPEQPGQFQETPLMELAINQIASGDAVVFGSEGKFIDTRADTQARTGFPPGTALALNKTALQLAVNQLPGKLNETLQTARLNYWSQPPFSEPVPGSDADSAVNITPIFAGDRRLMLSDLVRSNLRLASLKHPGLDEVQRETLEMAVKYPHGTTRPKLADNSEVTVHSFASAKSTDPDTLNYLTPNLVIERKVAGRTIVLACEPSGKVTAHTSLARAKQAWDETLKTQHPTETFSTTLTKVDADAFYIQASIAINLRNADAVNTTPTLLSPQQPDPSRHKVSDWIGNTSDANRFILHDLALELASYMHHHKDQTYNGGIPDIRTYIQDQLNAQSPRPVPYGIDDVEVVFHTPYGGTGAGFGFGSMKTTTLSLSDVFIQNLAGLPGGRREVRHKRTGTKIAQLETPGALNELVQRIDVGKHYPELLKRELLDDPAKKTERQLRFAQQVPIELKMKALELTSKGESGFDNPMGFRYLQAILDPTPGSKSINGNEITMRPLAFVREPGATPDVVESMYLIEPQDSTTGPHLLYRPLMANAPLLQFPSRQALMEAIQKPGTLQNDILAWLPNDATRTIYNNGGFSEPHLHRNRVVDDDFTALPTPAAPMLATAGDAVDNLATKLQSGQLMNHLYEANAKALTTLAEQQTVSDSQSRWATMKEGSFLILNAVLPALRGPAALIGLALQTQGVLGDLSTLANEKNGNKETAITDLLLNLASLVLHSSTRRPPEQAGLTPPRQANGAGNLPAKPAITVLDDNRLPLTEARVSSELDGKSYRHIVEAFQTEGLLIRTLQLRNAHLEFHNTHENLESIRSQGDADRGHGGLRKWSLAQADLLPSYYKMGDHAGALPRNMAILAMPEKLQDNITAVHEKDAFSGNIQADTRYLGPEKARESMKSLLRDLKNQQGEHPDSALENSEIQTVGVPPDALVGLVFYGSNGQTWEAAKPQFQKVINRASNEFDGKEYPVFTYKVEGGKTKLEYLDTLKVAARAG